MRARGTQRRPQNGRHRRFLYTIYLRIFFFRIITRNVLYNMLRRRFIVLLYFYRKCVFETRNGEKCFLAKIMLRR